MATANEQDELVYNEGNAQFQEEEGLNQQGGREKAKRPSAAAKKAEDSAQRIGKMGEKLDHLCLAMLGPSRFGRADLDWRTVNLEYLP